MDNLNLFILNITVTLRCTLRCKLCVADVAKYDTPPHFEKEYLFDVIDRCFSIVDSVERFQLSGGEPLLHKDFGEILGKSMQYRDRFHKLGIFTNGALLPKQELIDQIISYGCNEKFMIYISDYGKNSPKAKEFAAILENAGIPYDIKDYSGLAQHAGGWVDYGDYEYQNFSEQKLKDIFEHCAVNKIGGIWSCRYGELHRCTRSASGMDLKKIPRMYGDYISLFADIPEVEYRQVQRNKLMELMQKPYLSACKYCSGDFGSEDPTKRYPAGEQV